MRKMRVQRGPLMEEFRHRWSIAYRLHSVEIRHSSHAFSWLKRNADEYEQSSCEDLSRFLTTINVVGLACVVDRPGYDKRYRGKYGRRQWQSLPDGIQRRRGARGEVRARQREKTPRYAGTQQSPR